MNPINWHSFFFLLFAVASSAFAVAVVVSTNIVRMALYLIMSLGATAALFFLAGADFVGAMQLMIYVGGTLVLLVFGVMLTAQGPFISMKTGGGDWILAVLLSGCLLALLVPAALSIPAWKNQSTLAQEEKTRQEVANAPDTATRLGMGLVGVRVDKLRTGESDKRPQRLLDGMSGYLLPFEIVSVHLLVVLIGAAYLARTKKRAAA